MKKTILSILVVIICVVIYILYTTFYRNDRLDKSANTYMKHLSQKYVKKEAEELSNKLFISNNTKDRDIVLKLTKYFKEYSYVYDTKVDPISGMIDKKNSIKKGDCKDFAMAMASVLLYNKRKVVIYIRDEFESSKSKYPGHVYLSLIDENNNHILFESQPIKEQNKSISPFDRYEKDIYDKNKNLVLTKYYSIKLKK